VPDNEGNTALHHACAVGNAKAVQTLVEHFPKLQIDQVNKLGQTALVKVLYALYSIHFGLVGDPRKSEMFSNSFEIWSGSVQKGLQQKLLCTRVG
jgi:hypothetical protein